MHASVITYVTGPRFGGAADRVSGRIALSPTRVRANEGGAGIASETTDRCVSVSRVTYKP
jgi:hypothetical protein